MEGWEETTFRETIDLITGYPFKSAEYTDSELGISLLRGDNISQGKLRWDNVKRWHDSNSTELAKYKLKEFDVVLAMDRPWIEAGLKYSVVRNTDLPCYLVQRVARIRGNSKIDSGFVRYLIGSKEFTEHVRSVETGTAVPHISANQILEFRFRLPPLPEQRAIAGVLSSLDDKIDLLHRQNKTLESLAETLFRQWFVEEAEDASDCQLSVGELIETVSVTHTFPNRDIIFLNTSDIYLGNVLKHDRENVESLPGQAKKSIMKGDILFSEIRPENGRWAYIDFDATEYVVSTKLMVLRNKGVFSQSFLYFYLTHPMTVAWLQTLAEGRSGTFPQITFDQIKELSVNVPSQDLLKTVCKMCDDWLMKIKINQSQIRTIERLRDTLLSKLMSGEVRVGP